MRRRTYSSIISLYLISCQPPEDRWGENGGIYAPPALAAVALHQRALLGELAAALPLLVAVTSQADEGAGSTAGHLVSCPSCFHIAHRMAGRMQEDQCPSGSIQLGMGSHRALVSPTNHTGLSAFFLHHLTSSLWEEE